MTDSIDKVYKAYDVRGIYPDPLNEDIAWKTGHATALYLKSKYAPSGPLTLVAGRDMRTSSPSLSKAMIDGILAAGADCIDIGMIDTPQIYFAINHLNATGGIQVTASHNPAQYNGFKVSGPKAKPIGEDTGLNDIKGVAKGVSKEKDGAKAGVKRGSLSTQDLTAPYKVHVLKFLQLQRPLKVVVDCSNGMSGRFIPDIFIGQKNLKITTLNLDITGSFKHEPNPLVDANLRELQEAILSQGADFGVCFDGDADRCIFVDEQARIVRCDILTAFLAKDFLKTNPGAAIIYDLRSSRVVKDEVLNAGGVPKRERVGHVFMKQALADTGGVFGGELSGHFYFRDNFKCDSGAIVFAVMSSVLSGYDQPLSQVIKPLLRYFSSGEINYEVADKDGAIKKLAERYKDAQIDYLDGITIEYDAWWCNIRKSNTEPLLRLNLEANTAELLKQKQEEVGQQLGTPVHH